MPNYQQQDDSDLTIPIITTQVTKKKNGSIGISAQSIGQIIIQEFAKYADNLHHSDTKSPQQDSSPPKQKPDQSESTPETGSNGG